MREHQFLIYFEEFFEGGNIQISADYDASTVDEKKSRGLDDSIIEGIVRVTSTQMINLCPTSICNLEFTSNVGFPCLGILSGVHSVEVESGMGIGRLGSIGGP